MVQEVAGALDEPSHAAADPRAEQRWFRRHPRLALSLFLLLGTLALDLQTATGTFGAMMEVELINDGPVTFLVFSRDGKILDPET